MKYFACGISMIRLIKLYHQTEVNTSINNNKKGGIFLAKMYTCDEVAERYKVKVITVWDWIRQRKLNAIKLGREYRISEDDLIQFENERKTIPANDKS